MLADSGWMLVLSLYCTPLEPILAKILTDFVRSARVVALYSLVRFDRPPSPRLRTGKRGDSLARGVPQRRARPRDAVLGGANPNGSLGAV